MDICQELSVDSSANEQFAIVVPGSSSLPETGPSEVLHEEGPSGKNQPGSRFRLSRRAMRRRPCAQHDVETDRPHDADERSVGAFQ